MGGYDPASITTKEHFHSGQVRALHLGAPMLADVDALVASTNMKVGTYTRLGDGTPGLGVPARNVTVSATAAGGSDTVGTITVTGLDANGDVLTEVIIPSQGSTVAGAKCFASVNANGIVGAGWVISAGNDTITVGWGTRIGVPSSAHKGKLRLSSAAQVFAVFLGGANVAPTIAFDDDLVSASYVDASAGTYNGDKELVVLAGYDITDESD